MSEHRYILEPYKGMNTRYRCPSCQQRDKTFSLYIDTETGEHIHPSVGRCNRESNCAYHYTPKQYFQDHNISFDAPQAKPYKPKPVTKLKPVSFTSIEIFKGSLKGHETNHFVKYLIQLFGSEITTELVSRYFIGTSKYQFKNKDFPNYISEQAATVFWQIDLQGKIRTGKIMLYNPATGKRVKEPFNHITWVHKAIEQPEFELRQCLFGEHLLIDKSKPIALCESEKTAVIASVYFEQFLKDKNFIWLAFGGIGFNIDKCSVLKGRTVTLFPDCSKPKEGKPTAFEQWSNKAKELSHLATFTVSDLLERKANEAEKKQGLDLADYLIRYDYKDFENLAKLNIQQSENLTKPNIEQQVKPVTPEPVYYFSKPEQPKPESWEQDITNLENYFAGITLPTQPVKLNRCSTITDCSLFIETHFATVKANNGKRTFLPFLNRLQELKQYFTQNHELI